MDQAAFERVSKPKLDGALNLDRLLPDAELFISFSSISAILGLPGMANYAAANAGLDALAAARRARGAHGLSIHWGPWLDTGMHAGELAERNTAELQRQGIEPLAPEDAVHLFRCLAGSRDSSVTVMATDWAAFGAARSSRKSRVFIERLGGAEARGDAASELAARLAAAESVHVRRKLLETAIRETAAQILRIPPQRLDSRRALGTLGLDSLMAVELRNRLEGLLARPLSATLAWNYPTIEALAAYLSGDTAADAPVAQAPIRSETSDSGEIAALAEVSLSDEEIARQLRAGRHP
jgi:myxalamid-type polyketide synthase MxaE and MxaD